MYHSIILMKVENTTYALMLQGPFQWPFSSTHTPFIQCFWWRVFTTWLGKLKKRYHKYNLQHNPQKGKTRLLYFLGYLVHFSIWFLLLFTKKANTKGGLNVVCIWQNWPIMQMVRFVASKEAHKVRISTHSLAKNCPRGLCLILSPLISV